MPGNTEFREIRVVHPHGFNYYDTFLRSLKEYLPGIDRWHVDDSSFKDGSEWIKVLDDRGRGEKIHALVPFWFAPPPVDRSLSKPFFDIVQIGNALSHREEGKKPLADRLIGICPYVEARQDRSNNEVGGEAVTAEMFAGALRVGGFTDLVTLDIHSYHAAKYIRDKEINHLNATAIPLFVDFSLENNFITENSQVGVLDLGALQACLHFVDLAGMDRREQLLIFKKMRKGHNVIDSSTLLYGDPEGRDILLVDDIKDTGGSIGTTCKSLREANCRSIRAFLTHGVLSYPARENITNLLKEGVIDSLVLTNSLPRAAFALEDVEGVEVISVAPMMAMMGRLMSNFSVEEILALPGIEPFILELRDKMEVWEDFLNQVEAIPVLE